MKICLISFDYWGFDSYILKELQHKGHEVSHINLNNFRYVYPSLPVRIGNALSKILFKKNIKRLKRQEYVLNELNKLGVMDSILVIRPDLLDSDTHEKIRLKTNQYIAYLYDSTKRFPVDHLLDGLFDKVFSFDEDDVKKYGFTHITNYIYLPKKEIVTDKEYKQKVFIVVSGDERLKSLNKIANELARINISYKFIVRASRKPKGLCSSIEHSKRNIECDELMQNLDESEVYLDLIRYGHNGLSFRVFESLAHQKKLITTNTSIKNYDFYNPDNILVIDENNVSINADFFGTPYKPLDEAVYNKYTIENWVHTVFNL